MSVHQGSVLGPLASHADRSGCVGLMLTARRGRVLVCSVRGQSMQSAEMIAGEWRRGCVPSALARGYKATG